MYNKLGEAILKTGERMEVGVITGPDKYCQRVTAYLHRLMVLCLFYPICV